MVFSLMTGLAETTARFWFNVSNESLWREWEYYAAEAAVSQTAGEGLQAPSIFNGKWSSALVTSLSRERIASQADVDGDDKEDLW